MNRTIIHILYSGLGGHRSVVFSYLQFSLLDDYRNVLLFFGVEELSDELKQKCLQKNLEFIYVKKASYFNSFTQLTKAIFSYSPHLIINHSLPVIAPLIFLKIKLKTKIICVDHASLGMKRRVDIIWSWLSFIFSNRMVFLSNTARKEIWIPAVTKVRVIGNGVNVNLFKPLDNKSEQDPMIKIVTHCRLVEMKDLPTILKALKIVKTRGLNFECRIAGDGELRNKLESISSSYGLSQEVKFTGILDEGNVANLLSKSDIYINSSLNETMSTAILQGMSAGLSCIVSDIQENMLLVNDNSTGLLFKTSNAEDLANKIDFLISHSTVRVNLGENARQKVIDEYSIKKVSNEYYILVNELVK